LFHYSFNKEGEEQVILVTYSVTGIYICQIIIINKEFHYFSTVYFKSNWADIVHFHWYWYISNVILYK